MVLGGKTKQNKNMSKEGDERGQEQKSVCIKTGGVCLKGKGGIPQLSLTEAPLFSVTLETQVVLN